MGRFGSGWVGGGKGGGWSGTAKLDFSPGFRQKERCRRGVMRSFFVWVLWGNPEFLDYGAPNGRLLT